MEILVSLTLCLILMGMGLSVITTFFNTQRAVNATYTNLNELLPVGTTFQQFIRAAVSPAPTPTTPAQPGVPGQPVPPFGIYTSSGALTCPPPPPGGAAPAPTPTPTAPPCFNKRQLVFFTNIDNRVAKVVATYSATPVTPTQGMFRVTRTLAEQTPTTCPVSTGTTTPSSRHFRCRFTTTSTRRTVIAVSHVTGSNLTAKPIFTYYLAGSTTPAPVSLFATCWQTAGTTPPGCPAAAIQSIGFDLVVNENPKVGHSADEETVTYEVSSSSQAFNPVVG